MPYEPIREMNPLLTPCGNDSLWRYMDFSKFMALLVNRKLYLTRVDKLAELGDKFEGTLPPITPKKYKGFFDNEFQKRYDTEKSKDFKRFYYVNCWHCNENESDAMWKLYVKGNQGIAIRTTFRKLIDSIKNEQKKIVIKYVEYKDQWKSHPDNKHIHIYTCLTKKKCFEHEKEVRLIWHNETAENSNCVGPEGIEISCNRTTLIDTVYLAPTNSAWFKLIIEKILHNYRIKAEVKQSYLDSEP